MKLGSVFKQEGQVENTQSIWLCTPKSEFSKDFVGLGLLLFLQCLNVVAIKTFNFLRVSRTLLAHIRISLLMVKFLVHSYTGFISKKKKKTYMYTRLRERCRHKSAVADALRGSFTKHSWYCSLLTKIHIFTFFLILFTTSLFVLFN